MKIKNWRKIAWAKEGRGTFKGVNLDELFAAHFRLDCARHYRNLALEAWNDKKKMHRFERQNARRNGD